MKYISTKKNAIFMLHHSTLDCYCIIAKNKMLDAPGLGGTRFIPFENLHAAVHCVTDLANSMFYKNALAKLPFTGAKQIIFCKDQNLSIEKRNDILLFAAECVNSLKGEFITGTDMGLFANDVALMASISPYILHGESGDTSQSTVFGIAYALANVISYILPHKTKADIRVLIQGAGKVGSLLIELLNSEGIQIFINEIDQEKIIQVTQSNPAICLSKLSGFRGDIFMPCAISHTVNYVDIKKMGVVIIAGAANNQLARLQDDALFIKNGIFYAPDFVINSGGTIQAAGSYLQWDKNKILEMIKLIPQQLREIYDFSRKKNMGTYHAAQRFALMNVNSY